MAKTTFHPEEDMPVFRLPDEHYFPPVHMAEPNGLLAVGGDLSPDRLIQAYSHGIFPWYSEGEPLLWWSLDPRMVLFPEEFHLPRSLSKVIRRGRFRVTFDLAFEAVMRGCAQDNRDDGTWITPDMIRAYVVLHHMGYAHSAEAWHQPEPDGAWLLAGGCYGVAIGGCYYGESMFYRVPDASKVAFAMLVERLRGQGFQLIDCQMATDHLARFGAREIPRSAFIPLMREALRLPIAQSLWSDDSDS